MTETEKEIQNAIIRAFGTRANSGMRVRRNNTGVAKFGKRFVKFGMPGQADLTLFVNGRQIEIEVESPGGRQSENQKKYQRMVEATGGIYILARSVQDVRNQLKGIL